MKAILLKHFGGPEAFESIELPMPVPQAGEVLIRTAAISINPVDAKTRAGKGMAGRIKDKMPVILGWDVSGTVVLTGSDVTNFKVGDDVFGMLNFPGLGQAYAEYVVANVSDLAIKPTNITHEEAAAATLAALTAWQDLVHCAKVKAGDRVLIHAAAGGVGHYAVQIAKYLGAYVIGTSSAANRDFVLSLGADQHIDYQHEKFDAVVKDLDFVLDAMGGEYIERSLKVIKNGGTLITMPSNLEPGLPEKALAMGIHGYFNMVKPSAEDMNTLAALLEKGILRSHISKVYAFDQMAEAHVHLETGRTVGKIVVKF